MTHRFSAFVIASLALAMPVPLCAKAEDMVSYSVQRGDTLYRLAARFMTDRRAAGEVAKINRVRDVRRIPIGSHLLIPRRVLKAEPVELRILSFSGAASLVIAQRSVPAGKGLVVAEGAEVKTGRNGFVALQGSDGSRISLPSNAWVRIIRSRRYLINAAGDIEIEVLDGRAEIQAAPQKPGERFRMRTPVSVSAVRGTEFRVAVDSAGTMSCTEVLGGHVAVTSPVRALEVAGGFGAAVDKSGGIFSEALLAPPQVIDPAKVQTDPDLAFALLPVGGVRAYRLQIGKDAAFVDVVGEVESAAPLAALPGLPNGNYFLRATAIASSGLEGMPDVRTFRRQRVGMSAEAGPSRLRDGFRFNWRSEGEGTSLYRFQLFAEGRADQALVDEAGLDETGLTLTRLDRGVYQWRVGVIQTTPDGSAEVWTPLQKFTVSN